MAKKKLETDGFDLDSDLDLDEFNFNDIDSAVSDEAKTPTSRNPVVQTFKGTISGAKSKLLDPSFLIKTTKNALPDQYGDVFNKTDQVLSSASSLYDEAVREIKPQLSRLAKKVDKLVPENNRVLKKLTSKFSNFVGDETSFKGTSKEEYENQAITNSLGEIFQAQNERSDALQARGMAEGKIKDNIESKRFNSNFGLLTSINENTFRVSAYTEKVNQAYQKKSLELQFRSYFTQAELLKTNQKFFEIFNKQHESIVKNTALPEYVKIKEWERVKEITRTKFINKIQDSFYGDDSVIKRAMDKVANKVKEQISSFKFGLEQGIMGVEGLEQLQEVNQSMASSGVEGISGYDLMGQTLGGFLGELLGGKISKFGRDHIDDDSPIAKFGYKLNAAFTNIPGTAAELGKSQFAEDNKFDNGIKGLGSRFLSFVSDIFRTDRPDMAMSTESNIGTLNAAAVFNEKTQKSITDVIPGLLSRIHREMRILRTGKKDTPLTTYDFTRNKFITSKELSDNIKEKLNQKVKDSSFGSSLDNTTELFKRELGSDTATRDLTDDQTNKLKDFLMKLSTISNMRYTKKNITETRLFKSLDDDTKKIVSDSLDNIVGSSDNPEKGEYQIEHSMKKLRAATPELRDEIELFIQAGYADILEEQGIIKKDKDGKTEIDPDKYFKLIKDNTIVSSDKNVKTSVKGISPKKALNAIKKTKLYNWFYKHGKGDADKHTGPMAQDVNKNMGEEAAPGGTSIDLTTMNGMNMAAIQALSDQQEKSNKNIGNNKLLKQIAINTSETVKLLREKGIGFGINTDELQQKAKTGFETAKTKVKSGFKKVKGIFSDTKDSIIDVIYKPIDLYIRGETIPALTAEFMRLGKYFDSESGNVILNLKDLKNAEGNIINEDGEVLLTIQNMKDGLLDKNGKQVNIGFKKVTNFVGNIFSNYIPTSFNFAKGLLTDVKDSIANALFNPVDIYVWYDTEPVMLARLIRIGHYADKETGKVIRNLLDIKNVKGSIIDKEGNVVLTLQDIDNGLLDKNGKEIKLGIRKYTDRISNLIFNTVPTGINKVKNMLTDIKDAFMEQVFKPVDLYIRGETIPAISVRLMKLGHYIDQETGKVILNFKDLKNVKGNIVNKAGEVVLTIQDLANGLLDKDGNEVYLGVKKFANMIASTAVGSFNKVKDFAKSIYGSIKDSSIGKKLKSLIPGFGKSGTDLSSTKTHNVIVDIRNILIKYTKIKPRKNMDMNKDYATEGETINKVKDTISGLKDAAKEDLDKLKQKYEKLDIKAKMEELKTKFSSSGVKGTIDKLKNKYKKLGIGDKLNNIKDTVTASNKYDYNNPEEGSYLKMFQNNTENMKNKRTGEEESPEPRYRSKGGLLGGVASLGGSLLGKLKGKKGILGAIGGVGSMFSKKDDTDENTDDEAKDKSKSIIDKAKDKAKSIREEAANFYKEQKDKLKEMKNKSNDPNKPAFNDRDGSGERDGSWKDRLKALAEKAKNKITGGDKQDSPEMRYRSKENIIDKILGGAAAIFGKLGTGITALLGMGSSLLSGVGSLIGLGGGTGIMGKVFGLLGKTIKAPFKLMKGAMGVARAIGTPLAKATSMASRLPGVAGIVSKVGMLRNGLMIGSLMTGGVGSAVMATASAAITAVGAILTSHVVLGAAAIAAAGYGIYKTYKYINRNNTDEFFNVRLSQYGFTLTESDKHHITEINQLEEYLQDGIIGYNMGQAYILKQKIDVKKIYSIFNIDEDDEERVQTFTEWFQNRFKPFFLTHLTALFSINRKLSLSDIKKLTDEEQLKYIDLSSFEDGPYDVEASPFTDIEKMSTDKTIIDNSIKTLKQAVKSGFKKDEKKVDAAAIKSKEEPKPSKSTISPEKDKLDKSKFNSPDNTINKPIPPAEGLGEPAGEDGNKPQNGYSAEANKESNVTVQKPSMAGGPVLPGTSLSKYLVLAKGVSLDGVNPYLLKNLNGMADEYGSIKGKKLLITDGYRTYAQQAALYRIKGPKKAARPGSSLHEKGLAIDMDTPDANAAEYLGLMRKYGFTRPVGGETWHLEPAGIQGRLQQAKRDSNFADNAIQASLFKGGGGYGTLKGAKQLGRDDNMAFKLLGISPQIIDNEANKKASNDTVFAKPKLAIVNNSNSKSTISTPQPSSFNKRQEAPNVQAKQNTKIIEQNKDMNSNITNTGDEEVRPVARPKQRSLNLPQQYSQRIDSSDGLGSSSLSKGIAESNDILSKSLKVQSEMLEVLKQIAENVSPEQLTKIKSSLSVVEGTQQPVNKPQNRPSSAPSQGVNLNRSSFR